MQRLWKLFLAPTSNWGMCRCISLAGSLTPNDECQRFLSWRIIGSSELQVSRLPNCGTTSSLKVSLVNGICRHAARTQEKKNKQKFHSQNLKTTGIDGRTILKWALKVAINCSYYKGCVKNEWIHGKYEALVDKYSQRKNWSSQTKNCPFATLSPQITLDLAWD
jgi:hypothetical protein